MYDGRLSPLVEGGHHVAVVHEEVEDDGEEPEVVRLNLVEEVLLVVLCVHSQRPVASVQSTNSLHPLEAQRHARVVHGLPSKLTAVVQVPAEPAHTQTYNTN